MRLVWLLAIVLAAPTRAEDWPQFQFNARHSGNAEDRAIDANRLGLLRAVPLSDGVYAAPVVAGGRVYVVDGSGAAWCLDAGSLETVWKFQSKGGSQNCNNVCSPAVAGKYLHFGTTAGFYYVLDRATGTVAAEIDCGEPIFSTPVVGKDRVYFATLGSRVFAMEPNGKVVWKWDFVADELGFSGNRWSGHDWLQFRGQRVTWKDHFVCSRDICLVDRTVVVPAGGRTLFLEDAGSAPKLKATGKIPDLDGKEFPATFGQSADDAGNVFVQWHRRDNVGRVDVLRLDGDAMKTGPFVPGTDTNIRIDALLSFAPVSVRGGDVFRSRPENGQGLCRHRTGEKETQTLSTRASICPAVLTKNHAIHCGLDGVVELIPLEGGKAVELKTAGNAAISAPPAVADGRIFVGCEDGYLYAFAPDGKAEPPAQSLDLTRIRSPLAGKMADPKYDWYTNYGNFACQNANDQGLATPLRMRWARRVEGTVKHLPVCGGGRLYTHTAEGQILAFEQDTGRLLWRRYFPDVYLSFTSPLYIDGKLLVPQAGLKHPFVRCLDAATGKLLWEAPFTGSPSWSRQFPPVVHGRVAIYASGSGEYATQGSEKFYVFGGRPVPTQDGREVMSFIYSNDNPYYPKNSHPRIWAWDLDTGKLVWEKDFSEQGRGGNDCGLCILDGKLYYSVFFGYDAVQRARRGLPEKNNGLTACLDPATGRVLWQTNDYYVTAKCTVSARDGRLYLGGQNRSRLGLDDRFIWCIDARDGSLIWRSDPVTSALNVVSVGERFVFCNALRGKGNVFDRESGKVNFSIQTNYACCRFTLSEPFVLGANMDMIDLSNGGKLVSTGPAIDSRECLGAVVSNGRIFYTSQASGLAVSQTFGPESEHLPAAWETGRNP